MSTPVAAPVKERPILFSAPMVRAILEGRKTQTRRVVEPQPELQDGWTLSARQNEGYAVRVKPDGYACDPFSDEKTWRCPYGVPGDRLWVRETVWRDQRDDRDRIFAATRELYIDRKNGLKHCTDISGKRITATESLANLTRNKFWKQQPSIFMPRWASRITLEVVKVRVERVQDISEEDAIAEGLRAQAGDDYGSGPGYKWRGVGYHDGVSFTKDGERTFHAPYGDGNCCCHKGREKYKPAICAYRELWDAINLKRGYGWDKNPWVWVIEFKRVAGAL